MNAANRTGAALAAAVLWIAGVAGAYGDGTAWYMNPVSNFTYRQEITISGSLTDGALTNFPLLVAITNQDNPVFAKAQSNGNDIAFTTADGRTNLAYEMEAYTNSGNKQLIAWVNMPVLAPGQSTTILMLYGNPSLTNQQNKAGVWTNNFLGVWHLNEAVSNGGTNYDSSPSGANAVRYGSGAGGAPGKIGGGNAYNGSDDYSQGSGLAINTNGFTISAWCYLADSTHGFYALETGNSGAEYFGFYGDGTPLFSVVNSNNGQVGTIGPVQSFSNWHYVVAVARPTYNQLFVDGVDVGSTWGTPAGFAADLRCQYIGSAGPWGSPWQGTLDELRMCGVARSANWVTACYRNQGNPDAYLAVGSEMQIYQWEYRQKITVAAAMTPNTDQTDFPMLALITNQANHLFDAARSDGGDILFTASDGVTKLAHEIETYTNSGAKQLVAWVKAPVLSHTNDTVFYMYYGNPTALRQQNSVAVWTNNFLAVWHLNEAVSAGGTNYDSSPSGANAVRYGSGAGGVAGKIGGGNAYNGTDDFSAGPGGTINTNGFTISAWVYSQQEGVKIIECGGDTHNYLCTVSEQGGLFSQLDGMTNQATCYTPTNVLTTSNWHYVTAVASPVQLLFYVDGAYSGSCGMNGILPGNRAVYIGHYVTQNNINWNGMLDEMRFCGVARSAEWIKTCYNNQNSPSAYMTFSNKQARTGGLVIKFW